MQDYEQIEWLTTCLSRGDTGRTEWNLGRLPNSERKSAEPNRQARLARMRAVRRVSIDYAVETIAEPISQNLSDSVRVPLRPPNLWLADLQGADLSGYDLSGAFLEYPARALSDCSTGNGCDSANHPSRSGTLEHVS